MASITSIHLPRSRFGGTTANLRSLFRGQKFLKLLKRLTVGQAVPLSVGSKLELSNYFSERLSLPNDLILPPYTHAFVRVCIILPCIYKVHVHVYTHVRTYILYEQLTRQQTKQHNTTQHNDTRDNNLFSKKKLPQVGLEPTTLCSLDECSTT